MNVQNNKVNNNQNIQLEKNPVNLPFIIIGFIGIVIVVLGISFFIFQFNKDEISVEKENLSQDDLMIEINEGDVLETNNDCDEFPEKLESCESFSCEFEHPLAETLDIEDIIMERNIIGLNEDGKCKYIEELPNNGKMECDYTENTKMIMVKSHKGLELSEEEFNILQGALNGGECKISGYD